MTKVCYFDIETKYTFQELDNRWETLSYNQQNEIRDDLIPKMGLATSCVISEENSDKAIFFNEGDEKELISFIDRFDTIIGHNILHFDYLVLNPFYDHGDIIDHFAKKTIDTLDYLKKRTGRYIKLDDLAKFNLNSRKIMNPIDAPRKWREGQKDEVRNYCRSDVELLRKIYLKGVEEKNLIYPDKYGSKKVSIEW